MDSKLISLIKKYDCSGPRYTSYPPAPAFAPSFTEADYRTTVRETEASATSDDLSLYFHFPFCDTLCYFCGCTTVITNNRSRIDEYIGYLKKEIDLLAPMINPNRKVVQMHWGGGTPTYLTPSQIIEIGSYIRRKFTLDENAEVSVEVDPRDLTYHHLRALRNVGFNRISLGVQDFNPRVQQAVNRKQSEFITREAIEWSRTLGFRSLNLDLIYGLPLQTVESFQQTLNAIIDIAPERIAVYNFAYVPWMKKQQTLIHPEDLPSPDTKLAILTNTIDTLTDAGYVYIGMDHFAKPDDELAVAQRNRTLNRNFQGYSTKAGADMYGFGMSSIGHYGTSYAQNAKTLPEYYKALNEGRLATHVGYRMTQDDVIRKHVILKLMCDLRLVKAEVEQKFGLKFDGYFAESLEKLAPLVEDGLIEYRESGLTVTYIGRLLLRNIAMCFDAYTPRVAAQKRQQPMYSRTV